MEGESMDIDYRVLLPVTTQAWRLKKITDGIKDKSKLIVVHNYNHPKTLEYGQELGKQGAEIIPFEGDNRGACISWNKGINKFDTTKVNLVFILSPGTLFKNGTDEFINAVVASEKKHSNWFYSMPLDGFHTVCITRKLYEKVGSFDENLYPCYRDDADFQHRCFLLDCGFKDIEFDIPHEISLGTGVRHNRLFAHYWANINIQTPYYITKWGGDSGLEVFKLPFQDKPLSYWLPDQTKKVPLSAITKEMGDYWIKKRTWPDGTFVDGGDHEYD